VPCLGVGSRAPATTWAIIVCVCVVPMDGGPCCGCWLQGVARPGTALSHHPCSPTALLHPRCPPSCPCPSPASPSAPRPWHGTCPVLFLALLRCQGALPVCVYVLNDCAGPTNPFPRQPAVMACSSTTGSRPTRSLWTTPLPGSTRRCGLGPPMACVCLCVRVGPGGPVPQCHADHCCLCTPAWPRLPLTIRWRS
jgi:hypothetical protein